MAKHVRYLHSQWCPMCHHFHTRMEQLPTIPELGKYGGQWVLACAKCGHGAVQRKVKGAWINQLARVAKP